MGNRKNAMLTSEDRRWLTGEKTYEGKHAKQQRYQRRKDIRERVHNSILDFTLLLENLDEDEREKIFGSTTADGRVWEMNDEPLRDGIRNGLAFLLYNVGVTELVCETSENREPTVAERVLVDALYRAGKKDGILVEDADLDLQATQVSIPELLTDLETGNDISPAGLRLLVESDIADKAAVQECVRELVFDEESATREIDDDGTGNTMGRE